MSVSMQKATEPSFSPGDTSSQVLLEVRSISKRFGATQALSQVSMVFLKGKIHCVLGENGAGKSTVGKIICGLHGADLGEIIHDGSQVVFDNPRAARAAGIVMVYQELSLAPHLSVRANLWLGSEPGRSPLCLVSRRKERDKVALILERLGLAHIDMEKEVRHFPVAVQQLVEIGKSLMSDPSLIIFDEPTAMLGAVEKERFFAVLRTLRDNGLATVLVTHHIDDVLTVGDHVTVMRDGRVAQSFPVTSDIDADHIVKRLTGKSQKSGRRREASERGFPRLLDIERMPTFDGPRMLTVGRGEVLGLYGVVGCGSETLVKALVGLVPTADMRPVTFQLDGLRYRPRDLAHAHRLGVSYLAAGRASNGVLPGCSISENLMLTQLRSVSRLGFINSGKEARCADELLREAQVKFSHSADPITSLSGGNQQKILLVRAMAAARRVLVLEEPTAGVDLEAKRHIHLRIRAIAATGIGVVVMSSDLPETIELCDTVWTFSDGKVAGIYGSPTEEDKAAIVADVVGSQCLDTSTQAIRENHS
ncbi:sugar ABC transporter ATP-binding protein [Alloalcanivorax marinus]|uniref:sugar ABC transporter ATP-binding protein n=1 Tax=Alloalcanivorax marinus TaxID=1177169 RepID=UPI001931603F|nr:sugar ABC transporter ATP-binding protein [Alloalcanivorax marinus]MBL7251096.1 sugar ABC transporter ATP-binding protein [Alloalcanivorax marinus]